MRALEGLVVAGYVALVLGLLALLVASVVAVWHVWVAGLHWEAVVLVAAVAGEYVNRLHAQRQARR